MVRNAHRPIRRTKAPPPIAAAHDFDAPRVVDLERNLDVVEREILMLEDHARQLWKRLVRNPSFQRETNRLASSRRVRPFSLNFLPSFHEARLCLFVLEGQVSLHSRMEEVCAYLERLESLGHDAVGLTNTLKEVSRRGGAPGGFWEEAKTAIQLYGGKSSSGPPPLIKDPKDRESCPDPDEARSPEEFVQKMREFLQWAGGYSSRELSGWSQGAFSHTTIAAILSKKKTGRRPPVTMKYVRGFISACGGGEGEIERWVSAYRRVYLDLPLSQSVPKDEVVVVLSGRRTEAG